MLRLPLPVRTPKKVAGTLRVPVQSVAVCPADGTWSVPATMRPGFTLVEMLVSVGLVVLMMTMFAQVFQMATGSLSKQKGLAENDQRARTLDTIIRNDLRHRTHTVVQALREDMEGYFYIAENDLDNDGDDVLQFTVRMSADNPLYGKATNLGGVSTNPNQPDAEDGYLTANETGASRVGEVVYFLRRGRLYRRHLLIRERLDSTSYDLQPWPGPTGASTTGYTTAFFTAAYPTPATAAPFWHNFDYSAVYDSSTSQVMFHVLPNSLSNIPTAGTGFLYSLGFPQYRFGHNVTTGMPLEYVGSAYIGRFTIDETSFYEDRNLNGSLDTGEDLNGNGALDSFGYPGLIPTAGNPFARTDLTLTANGVVSQYQQGLRQSEDLLLTNVYSFDVKVWDHGLNVPSFQNIGHAGTVAAGTAGYFGSANNGDATYSPAYSATSGGGNRFDTWHRSLVTYTGTPPTTLTNAPPYRFGPDGYPGTNADDNADTNVNYVPVGTPPTSYIPDYAELDATGSDDTPPMRAIQIKIRYLDVTSNQIRELTIVESLLN